MKESGLIVSAITLQKYQKKIGDFKCNFLENLVITGLFTRKPDENTQYQINLEQKFSILILNGQ